VIHHVSVGVNDLARARAFYDPVMESLGLRVMQERDTGVEYGAGTFLFTANIPADGGTATPGNGAHIAFAVEHQDMVDAFHRIALAHGGSDDGGPGVRPHYDAHYYAAFVRDPDGNKIEAVTFAAG
jgi:catechol 2,3-dioxygenase-like lactoylglutathione lyase family enzyme